MKAAAIIVSMIFLFLFNAIALWLIYSMGEMVNVGTYTRGQAIALVSQMAVVTTGLAFLGMIAARLLMRSGSAGKTALVGSIGAMAALWGYVALNMMWRERWQPGGETPAFLPPWSNLNAHFFHEYNWLSYALFLTPLTMIASGAISFLLSALSSSGSRDIHAG